mmetsp:Transcript_59234/g.173255  ORF Transcript_59234/g.173255 Transcript_59234/m.173255 type:complete len:386 (+) Transcript_59234:116-1273(+)
MRPVTGPSWTVTVHIDRDLGLQTTKSLPRGATVAELKQALAADDPTGKAQARDFLLSPLRPGTLEAAGAAVVADSTPISEQLRELVLCKAPSGDLAVQAEVVEYRVLQRTQVKKLGSDPATGGAVKLTRRVGSTIFTTGRTWTGPRGGEWVELDHVVEKPGWLLVQGPGFGVPGPLLRKVEVGEEPPLLLRAERPGESGSLEGEAEMREFVISTNARVSEVKEWIALLFGLEPTSLLVAARGEETTAVAGYKINQGGLLRDSVTVSEAGFEEGDEVHYVYTGNLQTSYEGKEPSWNGKLGRQSKVKTSAKDSLSSNGASARPELAPHLEVLGLSKSTPIGDIKRHYRRLALEWHPDKHRGCEEAATQKFQEIKDAYEKLRDALSL